MKDSLRNKVVIVTGASSGIGRSIVLESAGRGATVILIARRKERLDEIAAEARELSGAEAYVFPTDMGKPDDIEKAFDEITKQVKHIDFLVNCAGFGKFEEFMEQKMQDVTNIFQVNVLGLMYFTRLVGRVMMEQETGQIINFGSITGKVPTYFNSMSYSTFNTRYSCIKFLCYIWIKFFSNPTYYFRMFIKDCYAFSYILIAFNMRWYA